MSKILDTYIPDSSNRYDFRRKLLDLYYETEKYFSADRIEVNIYKEEEELLCYTVEKPDHKNMEK